MRKRRDEESTCSGILQRIPGWLMDRSAERDRGWGMEDGFGAAWMNTKCDNRDGSARYSGGCQRTLAEICSVRDR